ncbi:MAG: TIGR00725 family protein [Candidatus Undinarchaeales archaeon]
MQISVIGSNESAGKEALKTAEELGKEIARAGAVLVCGGKLGVMEAACRGAKLEGGTTVGILPNSIEEANEFLDIKIPTGIGYARNTIVANSGDAVIAVCGSIGTLIEILYSCIFGKKVILLKGTKGTADNFDKIMEIPEIKEKIEKCGAEVLEAETPKEAVEIALRSI